jgi:ribosomal protein L40E
MALEYYTVKFANDAAGIAQKNAYTNQMAAQGWHIASEAIEQGHMKGDEACCGFMLCAPLAFLAGRTPAMIVTTFARENPTLLGSSTCSRCGVLVPANATFCGQCGARMSPK